MSHRLQVLISPELDAQLTKAAQRSRMSKGAWVRRVLQESVVRTGNLAAGADPLTELVSLQAPTGDIEQMLSEIEAGRV